MTLALSVLYIHVHVATVLWTSWYFGIECIADTCMECAKKLPAITKERQP